MKDLWKIIRSTPNLAFFLAGLFLAPNHALECIAHRGFSSSYRENTIEAISRAREAGADIVEVDVRLTSDNQLILFHDDEISSIKVRSISYPKIQNLTPDYHVPTLKQAIEAGSSRQSFLLDLKEAGPEFSDKLVALAEALPPDAPGLLYQSRDMETLNALRDNLNKPSLFLVTSLERSGLLRRIPDPERLSSQLVDNRITGISAKGRRFIDRHFVNLFQEKGLLFYVWTINPPDRIRHYTELGVDGIITDYPNRVTDEAGNLTPKEKQQRSP